MATLSIEFSSTRDKAGYVVRGKRIVRNDGELEEIRPLAHHPTLYLQFASLPDEPGAFIEFMGLFGPLSHEGHLGGESVESLIGKRLQMERCVELARTRPQQLMQLDALSAAEQRAISKMWDKAMERATGKAPARESAPRANAAATVKAVLRPGPPDGRPTLCLEPDTLWDAMMLQFQQAISAGSSLKACACCGRWFEAGPNGRRADARYCSDRCRIQANLQKAKGGRS